MGDENPTRSLGDYSRPSHEGYRNTIDLPDGNNVVPLRSDTIRLVQYECSFHELWCGQASNWLERLPTGSISTWKDLTARFLAQLFPSRKTVKLQNDILMFQQHQGKSLSEAWTHFKDLLQKVPHHGIDLWLQVQIFYDHVNPATRRTIDHSVDGLVSNFMAYQDAKLSKFEADFKQQQGEMTNKIDTLLKAINDRITISLLSDTVKILKLNDNSTSPVLSVRSYPTRDPQCLSQIYDLINAITICSKYLNKSHNDQPQGHDTTTEECKMSKEEGKEEKGDPNNINTNPPSPPDPSISFIIEKVCKLNSFLESINLVP
nr:hypothetical protein [Tanacetum cinerariifolium]